MKKTAPENIKYDDLMLLKNSQVRLFAVQHRVTREMFIVGTREECSDFLKRYE
jgi:hypothetical protein